MRSTTIVYSILLLLFCQVLTAQPRKENVEHQDEILTVRLSEMAVAPKASPYVTSWGSSGDNVRIRVINYDTVDHHPKLPVTVYKRDTLVVDTDPNLLPTVDAVRGSREFRGQDFFRAEAVRLHRMQTRSVLPSGRLLPGAYKVCIGSLCRDFTVDSWPTPRLLAPLTGASVPISSAMPLTLRWTDIATFPEDRITYRVKIVPLKPGQSPEAAFGMNLPIFDHNVTGTTELQWDGEEIDASTISWIWSVQGLDEEGFPTGGWAVPAVIGNALGE